MFHLHTRCRACGWGEPVLPSGIKAAQSDERLIPVLSLGVQPLANDFVRPDEEHAGFAPLEVLLCPRCDLAQLSVVVRPSILYSRYAYVTSPTRMMQEHFGSLWQDICSSFGAQAATVAEIGSNDGTLLRFLQAHGVKKVVGIEPATNLSELATRGDVPTINSLFDRESAMKAFAMLQASPEVIIARHVFCHVDDWHSFISAVEYLMGRNTLTCIEVPYVGDLLQNVQWDTIYHEHTSYLSIKAMVALLDKTKLYLHRIIRYPIHGGALMLMLRRRSFQQPADGSVQDMLEAEHVGEDAWRVFAKRVTGNIDSLWTVISNLVASGKSVAGFGASAKSTVCINACGFTRKEIRFITDTTPQKQYCTSPGSDIPIVDEGALLRELPDYALLFAWNYQAECIAKHQQYLSSGGHFIIPHPQVEIIMKP